MRFWEDWWIGPKSLKHSFSRLYNICFDKNKSVKNILDNGIENMRFRKTLMRDSLKLWNHIKEVCDSIALNNEKDVGLDSNKKWSLFCKVFL